MSGELVVTPADTFLAHYGVPGMKWGKRKAQAFKANRNSPQYLATKAAKKNDLQAVKNRRTLSNDEINKRIERLSKEKKLKELTEDDLRPGRKVAKAIVSQSGQRVVSALLVGAMAYGAKAAMDQKFDKKELREFMTPQNPNKKKK